MDMISEHYYASGTEHTDMKLGKKVRIEPPLSSVELQRAAAVQVRAKYEHYEKYLGTHSLAQGKACAHRH